MTGQASFPPIPPFGHYRGYLIELKLVDPANHVPADQDVAAFCPEIAVALQKLRDSIDRHLEYAKITSHFESDFLAPMVENGFSKAQILEAIAEFAYHAHWPNEVVQNIKYAAAALQDDAMNPTANPAANPAAHTAIDPPPLQAPLPPPEA